MTGPTVVFAWRRTPPPLLIGGAEVSQQLLAEEFARAGWQVIYLGSHEAPWDGSAQIGHLRAHLQAHDTEWEEAGGEVRYTWNGVRCRAVPQDRVEKALREVLGTVRAELVVTSQEGAADLAALARRSSRVAGWLHSVSANSMDVLHGEPHVALATSKFVAERVQTQTQAHTKPVVFYPPFTPTGGDEHNLPAGHGRAGHLPSGVLMVNPVPAKGAALLHQLIHRLPGRRFTLVEGWWDAAHEFTGYPNVQWAPRTYAMGPLYAANNLLLVPSQVEDAFPRVIVEAGLHGIPTVGSSRGGIPEAIGGGGVILHPDDVDAWVRAIESVDRASLGAKARTRAMPLVRSCLPELAAAGLIPAAATG
ncbi:glycosyltransferase [Streptomyces sp. TLI_146]|uniref:glycosyltransferase n=1 Tax=Streptomyces sp. TLI_146 TaxID=1938858 RepID=UPI000CBF05A4|nr:glycosyltransferase [Streptomyces sp. TLI_146]PKV89919.1 glycosyltransferase involved in cell wall biosynthesis [Streptomyces sp. TLI_146]